MKWDQEKIGLEHGSDMHSVDDVNDFNMGVTQNKINESFNTACALTSPKTGNDVDYERVECVIECKYFHYRTSNRLIYKYWFKLPLSIVHHEKS